MSDLDPTPEHTEPPDPMDAIRPFLGKAKELPERTLDVLRHMLEKARPVEGAGSAEVEPCPVCGTKIDGTLVSVQIPGRRSELVPARLVHMVLAHDFFHPSMKIMVGGQSPEQEPSNGHGHDHADSDDEVVERVDLDALPFSSVSDEDLENLEVDVSALVSEYRGTRRPASESRRAPSLEPRAQSPRRNEMVYGGRPDPEADQIQAAYQVSPTLAAGIVDIARAVGASPADLANLVHFESGFDPAARGPSDVGATGLIQFTPRTARSLGTTTDLLRRMAAEQQLPYIRKYLDSVRKGRPLDTPQKLYMAVFYPAAMEWGPDQVFPDEVIEKNTYRSGGETVSIRTPADYGRRVELRAKMPPSVKFGPAQASPLDGIFSFFSNLFSNLTGAGAPSSEEGSSTASMASWTAAPGVSAILVDPSGTEWRPGRVPPGRYKLVVQGCPPSDVTLEAGRSYRASGVGRMFGDVVDGG